ncbi:phosphate signaling complex PhoU family protein [Natrinema versiforme]|uniref:Transcriptional regulator n=1 Tax=Natrinema versiforme JCM 10478 TaxID=1227496 RepID=L9XNB3_9EURY|nr:phosphate uptake regulator PhoU [Natrinema versiforme]ELY63240.1 transcriptional regulator [Natrinema versiforme JCM 10478]
METRKVQLSGGTTYTISLPKSWAQEHGIDAGSALSLYPNGDGSLLVETGADRTTETRSTTVDVSTDSDSAIRQWIHALHAVGFDTVTLVDRTGHSTEHREIIEDTVANLSGFELLEAGDTKIRLTNLIDAENVDIRKSMLRLRLVMLGMHRDAVSAVLTDDETLAQRVIDRDNEADKLFAMVTRHFRRALTNLHEVEKLEYTRDELFEYYYVCRQFERIADHAERIARFTSDPEVTIPASFEDRIDSLASSSRQIINSAADVILADAGVEGAQTALTQRDELTADLRSLDRDLYAHDDPAEAYVVGLLLNSIRRTGEYGANIAGIAIQQCARECECPD